MTERPFNVLFLCRKFRALNHGGSGSEQTRRGQIPCVQRRQPFERFDASRSAAASAVEILDRVCAPALDFVFTACDNAAGEGCPVWPGQPMTAHWGVPDPAEATGSPAEIALAFKGAYRMLSQRIGVFAALPLRSLDRLSLQSKLREIGGIEGAMAKASGSI